MGIESTCTNRRSRHPCDGHERNAIFRHLHCSAASSIVSQCNASIARWYRLHLCIRGHARRHWSLVIATGIDRARCWGRSGKWRSQVPRARLNSSDGETTGWESGALRAYQRRTLAADALIAGCSGLSRARRPRDRQRADAFACVTYVNAKVSEEVGLAACRRRSIRQREADCFCRLARKLEPRRGLHRRPRLLIEVWRARVRPRKSGAM